MLFLTLLGSSLGLESDEVIPHRRAISLLPYKTTPDQGIAEAVGLFEVQKPIDLRRPYARVLSDQPKHPFQIATRSARFG